MSDHLTMQWLLSALLIASGAARLTRRTRCRQPAALPAALLLGGVLTAVFCLIIVHFASPALLLPALLLLVGLSTGAAAFQGLAGGRWNRRRIASTVLLALWLAVLIALTVLLREPEDTNVLLHFDALPAVVARRDLRPLRDVLQNLLLFLPLGLLLPIADSNAEAAWLNVLSSALLLTAAVEGAQLLFRLGQADVEDLAANVLGAMSGWALQHVLRRKPDSTH